LLVQVVLEQN